MTIEVAGRTATAVVGRSEFSAKALAADDVSGCIQVLHVRRTNTSQIGLTGGINAMVRRWVIELDGDREIESIHQADVVVVASRCRAGKGKFSQRSSAGSGMGALQLAAVSGRTRTLAGAVESAVTSSPEPACDPGDRDGSSQTRAGGHFQTAWRTVEYRRWSASPCHPNSLRAIVL